MLLDGIFAEVALFDRTQPEGLALATVLGGWGTLANLLGARGISALLCCRLAAGGVKDRNALLAVFAASTNVFCCCCAVTVSFDTLFGHTSAFALRSFLRHRGGVLQPYPVLSAVALCTRTSHTHTRTFPRAGPAL